MEPENGSKILKYIFHYKPSAHSIYSIKYNLKLIVNKKAVIIQKNFLHCVLKFIRENKILNLPYTQKNTKYLLQNTVKARYSTV